MNIRFTEATLSANHYFSVSLTGPIFQFSNRLSASTNTPYSIWSISCGQSLRSYIDSKMRISAPVRGLIRLRFLRYDCYSHLHRPPEADQRNVGPFGATALIQCISHRCLHFIEDSFLGLLLEGFKDFTSEDGDASCQGY